MPWNSPLTDVTSSTAAHKTQVGQPLLDGRYQALFQGSRWVPKGRGPPFLFSLFYISTEVSPLDGQSFYISQDTFFVPKLSVFSGISSLGSQETPPLPHCIIGASHLISVGLSILVCRKESQKGSLGNYELKRNNVFCTELGCQDTCSVKDCPCQQCWNPRCPVD